MMLKEGCWEKLWEEKYTDIEHGEIWIICPFCGHIESFPEGFIPYREAGDDLTCPGCGAEFREGYDDAVRFIRRKPVA